MIDTTSFSKKFDNGVKLAFGRGKFDDYCVYYIEHETRTPLLDRDYFSSLKRYADKYGSLKVYNDFVKVYDVTGKNITQNSLDTIHEISVTYEESLDVEILLTVLYMTMIAEENKKYTRLGRRIKRLGIHTLLIEKKDLRYAVNFMKGMNWRKIDRLCRERGF